ncbi:epimerase [Rudanella paleaurantiibacter]|uniref:Epimerase n=1 Tax=Rudanella paleaurantiibacter TaxID=2614655 RepID=A0A7J5TS04_9BACT|nr:epimerase [Rudanella paleaurantiibacter]KAB7725604.1 epimerase [Rudanella paleaurantiibacter]
MKLKAIITGATGMVGEGVLHECLLHPDVEHILVVGRKACGVGHPKLKELLVPDFFDLSAVEADLSGYNACFFCLGTSSLGMSEHDFYKVTYTLTLNFAQTLSTLNPDMTFCYVSGAGTDSTEKGRTMWARVKGKTENDLMKLPFRQVYNFRPGYIQPTEGLKNTLPYYKYLSWLYPAFRVLFASYVCSLKEIGLAMIHCAGNGQQKTVVEVKGIKALAG